MRRFYTTYEAAHLLGVSLPTVVNWINARRLKAHRTPGGHRRISREDLATFISRHGMPMPQELVGAVPSSRRALVIGPSGAGREEAAAELTAAGYEVAQAVPGFGAGIAVGRFRPDVVVLCEEGPVVNEILEALRAEPETRALPVVHSSSMMAGTRGGVVAGAVAQALGVGRQTRRTPRS
jgi:excisionase family DNA binding protein